MSRKFTITIVLLCTIAFNVFLVWQLDSVLYYGSDVLGRASIWIEEDIALSYDSEMVNPSGSRLSPVVHIRDVSSSGVTSLGRRGCSDNTSRDVECYFSYIHLLEGTNSRRVPQWARLLAIPTSGYHSFNATISDQLGNNREILPDTRDTECHALNYDVILTGLSSAGASVVVIFHNEARSTLLRTIHSVLLRTPEVLLVELILVDDASTFPWLQEALADYVRHIPKTRLIRLGRRRGLMRARLAGAEIARGRVLVFLDSHTEVNKGWLEPLLYRIYQVNVLLYTQMLPLFQNHLNLLICE